MDMPIDENNQIKLPAMATPDFLVAMADGTWKPFKDLRVGDQLVSDKGKMQIVSESGDFHNLKRS